MFKCVEGNNADRVVELPGQKVGDDSFGVRPPDFRFAVNATQPAKAVDYEVRGLIRAVGHGRWRPAGPTHNALHTTAPDSIIGTLDRSRRTRAYPFTFAQLREVEPSSFITRRSRFLAVVCSAVNCGPVVGPAIIRSA